MLSEARARLANTQGKKAKRKARERQLEQSRRVAALQKRRELKMSGINIKIKTARKGEMDYNADIPFEHAPAKGYYNTEEEEKRNLAQLAAFDPRKQQVANKRKGEDQDDADDRKRQKNDKGQGGQSVSAAAMKAAQQQKIREAEQSSKRRALVLPSPQLKETELDQVVKEQRSAQRAIEMAGTGDNEATRGLVGNYNTNLLGATPMRTPRAAPEEDRVANEVRNLRAMTNTQSALLGGDGPELVGGSGSTGFEGATPRPHVVATPNPMATPFRQVNGTGATPMRNGPGATPMMTPRDTLNLNRVNNMQLVGQTPRDLRLHEKAAKQSLLDKLASLPKPKAVEYDFNVPEEEQESTTLALSEEDAAIRDARDKKLRDAAELAEFKRQTQVTQRRLPRPTVIDVDAMLKNARDIKDPIRQAVAIESALLIASDGRKFGGTKVTGSSKPLQPFDDSLLEKARSLVKNAVEDTPDFTDAWIEVHGSAKLPGLDGYYEDEIDEHQMMVEVFDNIEDKITETAEKGQELEKKLAKLHGGYQARSKMLQQKILAVADKLEKTKIDVNTFRNAQAGEEAAAARRLEALRDEVAFISRREREAQEEYRSTQQELGDLPAPINGFH
jgi:pre-mRNA-splicing factor CDC5/CEF1